MQPVSRPTSSSSDRARRTQKDTVSQPNRAMGAIVGGSVEPRGSRALDAVEEIVARARANSGLSVADAMALAVEETKRHREGR